MPNKRSATRPPNGTLIETRPHPSRGGNAWPQEVRDQVIWMYENNKNLNSPQIMAMREEKLFPCYNTCTNWIKKYLTENHCLAKRPTGNKLAEREIHGVALERLALFYCVMPKGTYAECKAFLFNMGCSTKPYSDSQIARAKDLLDIRRKVASTTSDKAYSPRNLHKRHLYWNHPPPLGMAGVRICDIIDIDEAGFKLGQTTSKYGYAACKFRCLDTGVYGHSKRVNLLLAISGDKHLGMRWHDCWTDGGTTLERFSDFMDMILDDLAMSFPHRQFTFTMDNLNVHKNPAVVAMIVSAGHRVVFRAPYWPVDGAIEYVFNTVHTHLYRCNINNLDQLRNSLILIVGRFRNFYKYFRHVGFIN